jgi:hypothetical protein
MSKSPSDIIVEVVGKLDLFSGVPSFIRRRKAMGVGPSLCALRRCGDFGGPKFYRARGDRRKLPRIVCDSPALSRRIKREPRRAGYGVQKLDAYPN